MDDHAIQDLFVELGPVRIRRMFGGRGLYLGDLIFAIEVGSDLYLNVDDQSVRSFQAVGSRPFTYERDGRGTRMSYWLLPDAALDEPTEAARWGRLALDDARRAGRTKRRSPRRRP